MRRSALSLTLFCVFFCAGAARAASLHGYVYLMPITTSFKSVGFVEFLNDLNYRDSATLTGTHRVSGPQVFETPVQGDGVYSYDLEGPAQPGACYGTSLVVSA